jgi:hypothetical protein
MSQVAIDSANYTITGYVLDSSGKGLAGASVILGEPTVAPGIFTDSTGHYSISAPAGTYWLTVWPPFDSNFLSYSDGSFFVGSNLNKNITLNSAYKISGNIWDLFWAPVSGASISLVSVATGNSYTSGWYSNSQGYYFVCAPAGLYTLNVWPKLGSNLQSYHESNVLVSGNMQKNVFLAFSTRISGYITNFSGKGILGATVTLNSQLSGNAVTDDSGYYTIYAPPGNYSFSVYPPYDSNYVSYNVPTFSVDGINMVENVALTSGYKVSGYITDTLGQPVSRATVTIGGFSSGNYSNYRGYYYVAVPPGTYTLTAKLQGSPSYSTYSEDNFTITSSTTKNITLNLPLPTPSPTPSPQIPSGFKISGYVTDSSSKGVIGASVIFYGPSGLSAAHFTTGVTGYYEFFVPANTYHVDVWPPYDSNYVNFDQAGFAVTADVSKNITLSTGYKISGYIADPSGSPIAGALVFLNTSVLSGYVSNSQGYYYVSAVAGTYAFNVRGPPGSVGYPGNIYSEQRFAVTTNGVKNVTLDYNNPPPTPVPSGFKLSGYITDSSGKGIASARVIIYNSSGLSAVPGVFTRSSGYYEIYVSAGTYQLTVFPPSNSSFVNHEEYNFVVNTDASKDITLASGNKVSGYISDSSGKPVSGAVVLLNGTFLSGYGSDSQGYYYASGPTGTYTISVRGPPNSPGYPNFIYSEANVFVPNNMVKNLTIVYSAIPSPTPSPSPTPTPLPNGFKLSGYVVDSSRNGIASARVFLYGSDGSASFSAAYTNSVGYYETYALAGTFHLTVFPPRDSNYVNYDESGLGMTANVSKNITLALGYKISGYVLDSSGKPIGGAFVFLNGSIFSGWGSTSQGYYYVSAPAGTYTYEVRGPTGSPGYPNMIYSEKGFAVNSDNAKNVTIVYSVSTQTPSPSPTPNQTPSPTPFQSPTAMPAITPNPTSTPIQTQTPTQPPTTSASTVSPIQTPTASPSQTNAPQTTQTTTEQTPIQTLNPTLTPTTNTPTATTTPTPFESPVSYPTQQGEVTRESQTLGLTPLTLAAVAIAAIAIAVAVLALLKVNKKSSARKT